jgi:hypothetical protein
MFLIDESQAMKFAEGIRRKSSIGGINKRFCLPNGFNKNLICLLVLPRVALLLNLDVKALAACVKYFFK